MKNFWRFIPSSVKVNTKGITTIVSSHYTVWVEHRNNLEDKLLSHILSVFSLLQKKIDDSLNQERGIAFARMHSTSQKDYLLRMRHTNPCKLLLFLIHIVRNGKHGTRITFDSFTQVLNSQYIFYVVFWIFLRSIKQVIVKVLQCIGLKLAEKHYVLIVVKVEAKC